jgi:hypothetical protein
MSIPVRFNWYNKSGDLLAANRGCFTISYGQQSGDLRLLSQRLQECSLEYHRKHIHPDVRYVVPLAAPDYMFDLEDLAAIIPNKYKDKS